MKAINRVVFAALGFLCVAFATCTKVETDSYSDYAWTGEFTAGGELKIGLGNGWGDQFFYAPTDNADPVTDHRLFMYRFQDDGGDIKWVPSVSGRYTFTLCLLADDMKTSFEPAQ